MTTELRVSVGDRAVDRLWLGMDRKWWTLVVVGSGTFMSALDTSIVNIALPAIGHSCVHRPMPITDSGPSRSLIPAEADHRFRSKPIAERMTR